MRFLLEIAAVLAFGYWGFTVGDGQVMKLVLGIGVPVLVIIIWATIVAPNAAVSTPNVVKVILGLIVLELAAVALANAGQVVIAAVMGLIVLVNAGLLLVWGQ